MVKAMPALLEYNSDVRLLIVGPTLFTGYERELKDLALYLGVYDKVFFMGPKPYTELPKWISCMDVCTIPLLPEQWGDIALPNKFFEYSACGKPILMRPMGNAERIGGKNLYIYHNELEYIQQLKNLMGGNDTFIPPDLTSYSWVAKARQFEDIFRSLGVED
jgi:glycosyltransferase involved in cell wall biosynthesis